MGRRMSEQDWAHIKACETFGHTEAHMIASEFEWSWSTCWFEGRGEFAHDIMSPRNGSYATVMDQALFGWWMDQDDDTRAKDRDHVARERMLAYLRNREARGDMGPVEGFRRMWHVNAMCEANARKGTGTGVCGLVLDARGQCAYARSHID